MKIDIAVISLEPLPERFIGMLEREIPVNQILVSSVKGRAQAREDVIGKVRTEWFAFVDADVRLSRGWFAALEPLLGPGVGAVWGVSLPSDPHLWNTMRTRALIHRISEVDLALRTRGFNTQDTVIRTAAVEGIRIPRDHHVAEDMYIGRHVTRQGYRWYKTKAAYCINDRVSSASDVPADWIRHGQVAKKYGYGTFRRALSAPIRALPEFFLNLAVTRDVTASKLLVRSQTLKLKGWLME